MAKNGSISIFKTILQIALAIMLIIGGLNVFLNADKGFHKLVGATGDKLVTAVSHLFEKGTLRDIVVYVLASYRSYYRSFTCIGFLPHQIS